MKFSRFTVPDYTTSPDVSKDNLPSSWYQAELDAKFRLSLKQTREELWKALRYKQAFEMLYQGMEEISERSALPPVQKRTAEAYMRLMRKNWPDLGD